MTCKCQTSNAAQALSVFSDESSLTLQQLIKTGGLGLCWVTAQNEFLVTSDGGQLHCPPPVPAQTDMSLVC